MKFTRPQTSTTGANAPGSLETDRNLAASGACGVCIKKQRRVLFSALFNLTFLAREKGNHNNFGGPRLNVSKQSVPLGQHRTSRELRRLWRVCGASAASEPQDCHEPGATIRRPAAPTLRRNAPSDRAGVLRGRFESRTTRQIRDRQGIGNQDCA